MAALPFAAGFGYLRLLVVGKPPHYKGDLWATALDLRLDFTDPPRRAVPDMAPRHRGRDSRVRARSAPRTGAIPRRRIQRPDHGPVLSRRMV